MELGSTKMGDRIREIQRATYGAVPEPVQNLIKKGIILANPRVSWRTWRRMPQAFITALFEDREEYESYAEEFWDSGIVDICMSAEERTREGVTVFDAHRDECERLYATIRKLQPKTLVETGVYHGVSTASILLALEASRTGELYSIDNSASLEDGETPDDEHRHYRRERPSCAEAGAHALPPDRDPGWIIPGDLRDRWSLRTGRSQRLLPGLLGELGGVDFFLHDSEHSTAGMLFEFETAWEWLLPGGLIVSHHIDWNDAFETFADERPCDSGLMTYTYYGEAAIPCRAGYVRKR